MLKLILRKVKGVLNMLQGQHPLPPAEIVNESYSMTIGSEPFTYEEAAQAGKWIDSSLYSLERELEMHLADYEKKTGHKIHDY